MSFLPSRRESAWRLTLGCVAALTALRLAVAGQVGLGTDEAHYALYGLHLDLSYFDHPPLVGWLQALVLATVGDSERALRLVPIALLALAALQAHALARRLFPDSHPAQPSLVAVCVLLTPMTQALGLGLVPEAPLLVLTLACADALSRLLARPRLSTWLMIGLWLGLAGLAKYTAVGLAAGVVLAVLLRHGLAAFARPGPWLAALLCLGLLTPVFVWNAQHDWISIRYQLGHGTGGHAWGLQRVAVTQLGQLLAFGPLLVVGGWQLLTRGWSQRAHDGALVCLTLAAPTALLFGFSSGFEVSLPHWWTLVWILLAPLLFDGFLAAPQPRWRRRLAGFSLGWSLFILVVLHSELLLPWMPLDDGRHPVGEVTGWDAAARRAGELADELPCGDQLYIDNWSRASRLAWYARPRSVQVLDDKLTQFDLWFGNPDAGDCGVLVIHDDGRDDELPSDLARFAEHTLLETQDVGRAGRRVGRFRFFACHDHRQP